VIAETERLPVRAEAIYSRYAADLVRFATGLVGPCDARDVVSDAMVRCLRTVEWDAIVDQRAYLYRAVLNEARSLQRGVRRRRAREVAAARSSNLAPTSPELRPEVLDAVRKLSVRQRAVIVLSYWQDLSPAEVAERLGISEGAVRRHLARARERLRRSLDDDRP
jgi:RNA polymerase sigma factor (sigma-70 family)